jgi:predicted site-specific integrase-resolvase
MLNHVNHLPFCIRYYNNPYIRKGRTKLKTQELLKLLCTRQRRPLVGYVRVSTTRQIDDGNSLETQRQSIELYAKEMNRELVEIYSDSTSGALPYTKRSCLKDAVRKAEALGCPIIVASPDRLSRNIDVLRHIDLRKSQIWVVGRGRLNRSELDQEIAEAALGLEQRREAGVSSWTSSARRKRTPGSTPATRDGGLIGSKSNKARSDENQAQIQRVLEARPETISMTCPEIALFLNELGVANENGRANDGPVLWTPTTLRRKLGRARNAINAISKGL